VADRVPHGLVDMEQGTVHSCNAYYAQLGRRVGWDELSRTASAWGIDLGKPGKEGQRANLRDASYGQGKVVATPLQMAGVAATFAGGGTLPEIRLVQDAGRPSPTETILEHDAAARIAGYMREVVLSGTARKLASSEIAIAGKTGTAQVASG